MLRYAVPGLLIAIWVATLFLPAVTVEHVNEDQTFPGLSVMLLGMFLGWAIFQFAAFANPVFLFALGYGAWRGDAAGRRMMRGFAVLLMLAIVSAAFWRILPDDSGPNPIIAHHAGFYLWLAVMACAALWLWFTAPRPQET
ncbi:hypothetical protein [Alteriqipengyuania sp. 357]